MRASEADGREAPVLALSSGGFREPQGSVQKQAEQVFEAWPPSERQGRNTACEAEISFSQHVWDAEQDRLSFICKQQKSRRFLASEVTHSRVKVNYQWIFSVGGAKKMGTLKM